MKILDLGVSLSKGSKVGVIFVSVQGYHFTFRHSLLHTILVRMVPSSDVNYS